MKYIRIGALIVLSSCHTGPRFRVDQTVLKCTFGYKVLTDVWDTEDDEKSSGRTIVQQFELNPEQATDSAKKADLYRAHKIADQLNAVK